MPSESNKTIIMFGFAVVAVVNCAAAVVVIAADRTLGDTLLLGQANATVASQQVWDSGRLLALCLIGATSGTMLKIFWAPLPVVTGVTNNDLTRMLAGKAITAMLCGLVITPVILRYMQWLPEADVLVALAGGVAFCGDITIGPALKFYQDWMSARDRQLRKLTDTNSDTDVTKG